jgi:uncharacterized protein DUF4157
MRVGGEPLDSSAATLAREQFGFDFSRVRIHRDERANTAANSMMARAYAYGEDVFFRRGERSAGGELLMHELAHVADQIGPRGTAPAMPSVMRAPAATAQAPATYIVVYGSGRVNPETMVAHNVGSLFKLAAEAKRREILARLGKAAAQSNIVFEYCPTERELQAVLNRKYELPVKEVHIFSHGWDEGINLGGPDPGPGKRGVDEKPQERRVVPEELGDYNVQFAEEPTVVLYGCNTGNPKGSPAFAQSVSDAFGVPVKGPTTSSHFEFGGPYGTSQVPDKPGKMVEYAPTQSAIDGHVKEIERRVSAIAVNMKTKGGLLQMMKSTQKAYTLRAELNRQVEWLNRVLGDKRYATPDRIQLRDRVAELVKRADSLLAGP